MLGLATERRGFARGGYTEPELFSVLKHGFDVMSMQSYTRFFVEFADTFTRFALKKAASEGDDSRRVMRICSVAGPFYQLASQLDMFLLFSKEHPVPQKMRPYLHYNRYEKAPKVLSHP